VAVNTSSVHILIVEMHKQRDGLGVVLCSV